MKDTLKSVGGTMLGICIFVGVGLLGGRILDGFVWLSSKIPPGDNHFVFASILVAIGIILIVVIARTHSLWLLNGLMLWGAGLGFIIGLSVVNLVDAANHIGTAILVGGRDNEEAAKVFEWQYKREKFAENGMMFGLAVLGWVVVAKTARNKAAL